MVRWVAIASINRVKSRKEGFVLRCKAGLSSYLEPGLEVRVIPPALDMPRVAHLQAVHCLAGDEAAVTFAESFNADACGWLVGKTLLADEAAFPPGLFAGERDLVGWEVIDGRFGVLGRVSLVVEGPAQRLLVVAGEDDEGRERNVPIPFVDAFIVQLDEEARRITTSIPGGLLTLEEA